MQLRTNQTKTFILDISIHIDMNVGFKLLKVLGEETKYNIIKFLLEGEKCACEIPSKIGRTQSNTSM
ncbi:MAG: ArsR family transcriptional regulator, partial [Nanoarchaeota archaeon]